MDLKNQTQKREIKFRGLLTHSKLTVIGNLIISKNGKPYIIPAEVFEPDGHHLIIDSDNPFWVEPETICQFTGLLDKSGLEIYEGDIIDHYALHGYVVYENGMFSISSNANTQFCNCKQPLAYHDVSEMEVIGNIHQNPSML